MPVRSGVRPSWASAVGDSAGFRLPGGVKLLQYLHTVVDGTPVPDRTNQTGSRPAGEVSFRASRRPPRLRRLRRRNGAESGAAALEFAIILPLLVVIIFGIVDFGFLLYQNQSMRYSTQQSARMMSVASFGSDSSCPLSPAPASVVMARVMCQTKTLSGLKGRSTFRVAVVIQGTYVKGNSAVLCTEYPQSAVSGFSSGVVGVVFGKVWKSKAVFRIESASKTDTLTSASETPLSGSWSWCG